jgi:uncharacterized protein YjgD (DUF1641 family)
MSTSNSDPFAAGLAARPPNQAELLQRIDARLERIEQRLAKLDPLLEAAPGLVAVLGDTFDEFSDQVGDLDERVRAALHLLERATRPKTLKQLEAALDIVESAPGLVAMLGDSFDEFATSLAERGVPLDQIVPELVKSLELLIDLLTNEQVRQLLASDLLLPNAITALGTAARALAVAQHTRTEPLGLLGALRAMSEPEVQRAVGFALDVARRFGANLQTTTALPPAKG